MQGVRPTSRAYSDADSGLVCRTTAAIVAVVVAAATSAAAADDFVWLRTQKKTSRTRGRVRT